VTAAAPLAESTATAAADLACSQVYRAIVVKSCPSQAQAPKSAGSGEASDRNPDAGSRYPRRHVYLVNPSLLCRHGVQSVLM